MLVRLNRSEWLHAVILAQQSVPLHHTSGPLQATGFSAMPKGHVVLKHQSYWRDGISAP